MKHIQNEEIRELFNKVCLTLELNNQELIIDTEAIKQYGEKIIQIYAKGTLANHLELAAGKHLIFINTLDIDKLFKLSGTEIFYCQPMWYKPCDIYTGILVLLIHELTHSMERRKSIDLKSFDEWIKFLEQLLKNKNKVDTQVDKREESAKWQLDHDDDFWCMFNKNLIKCKEIVKEYELNAARRKGTPSRWAFS